MERLLALFNDDTEGVVKALAAGAARMANEKAVENFIVYYSCLLDRYCVFKPTQWG
jgi:predicted LPLAT superfamily acyltransferase